MTRTRAGLSAWAPRHSAGAVFLCVALAWLPRIAAADPEKVLPDRSPFSVGLAVSEGMLPCMSGVYRTNVRWEFLATAEFDGGRWDFVRAGTGLEDPFAISVGSAYVFDIGPVYFLLGAQLLGARGTTLGGPVAGFGLLIEVGPGWWLDFGVSGAVYPTHALARPLFPIEASVGTRHDLWRE